VLDHFPAELQSEVVQRLADLAEADPDVLRELDSALRARLASRFGVRPKRVVGQQAIEDILRQCEPATSERIVANLGGRAPALAERFRPDPVAFDDLRRLADADLARLVAEAEHDVLSAALLAASPAWIARVLRLLSRGPAEAIARELSRPGPIRLSDVEEACRRMAQLAERLEQEGVIQLTRSRPAFARTA